LANSAKTNYINDSVIYKTKKSEFKKVNSNVGLSIVVLNYLKSPEYKEIEDNLSKKTVKTKRDDAKMKNVNQKQRTRSNSVKTLVGHPSSSLSKKKSKYLIDHFKYDKSKRYFEQGKKKFCKDNYNKLPERRMTIHSLAHTV
jgi:hypothetical protein